jgi:excisionase family DNA binding protein
VCGTELVALAEADLRFVEGLRSLLRVTLQNDRGAITGLLAIAAIDPAALGVGEVGFAPAIAHVVDTAVARRRAPAATVAAAARGAGGEAARGAAGPASASPSPPVGSLSLGQAAQALGISTTTARRWADDGRLGATRTAGGHRRFAVIEVRRLLAERGHPAVAPTQPPRRALPSLVQLTAEHASQLPELSWRSLYGELRTGFFTAPEGVAAAERWIGAIASAAETANYEMLHEATVAFMRAAERAGASLLERHLAIERFADTVTLALTRRSCPREELVEARRLFASLGQRQLAAAG